MKMLHEAKRRVPKSVCDGSENGIIGIIAKTESSNIDWRLPVLVFSCCNITESKDMSDFRYAIYK